MLEESDQRVQPLSEPTDAKYLKSHGRFMRSVVGALLWRRYAGGISLPVYDEGRWEKG